MRTLKVFLFCTLFLTATAIFSDTIVVDQNGNGDVTTIQEGINIASENDIVLVKPGVYQEAVTIETDNLTLLGAGPGSTAIYSTTENAVTFSSYVENSQIIGFSITSSGSSGIYVGSGTVGITNNIITGGQYGIHTSWAASTNSAISNCIIINCGQHGILFESSNHSVTNSILINNSGFAINSSAENVTSSFNNFWNNSNGSYGGDGDVVIGNGNLSQEPLFVDIDSDYHLTNNSPCIDAGKPGLASLDPDGTRNDMGVYGGSHANMSGFLGPVITELEIFPSVVEQGDTITIEAEGTIR